jgi:hypothetical protein
MHSSADVFGPLEGGERAAWHGQAGVAEYAFEKVGSMPRWTLPETTQILVTNRRVLYAHAAGGYEREITAGELRWQWPQYLRVQPGARTTDRGAAASQVQLVCGSADGSFPAIVFAGGELATVGDADKLANVLRQTIARFRLDHADRLQLSTAHSRMLSRLLIGPEFNNYQGGEGQTVSLLGALAVSRPEPIAEGTAAPIAEGTRVMTYRPGLEADATRAWAAARAEEEAQLAQPSLASRASELAARVADLVSTGEDDGPTTNLSERAEAIRRSTARFTANSAGSRAAARHEVRTGTRGNRDG